MYRILYIQSNEYVHMYRILYIQSNEYVHIYRILYLMNSVSVAVSEAPPEKVKERKYEKFDAATYKTAAQKRDELVS